MTKLYVNWDNAGTSRYVVNGFVWLLGLEHRAAKEKEALHATGLLRRQMTNTEADDVLPFCRYGMECRNISMSSHLKQFSHRKLPCRYGEKCRDQDEKHRLAFSHMEAGELCCFGVLCR